MQFDTSGGKYWRILGLSVSEYKNDRRKCCYSGEDRVPNRLQSLGFGLFDHYIENVVWMIRIQMMCRF